MITIQRTDIISEIVYGIHQTQFGLCLIEITNQGISHISFIEKNSVKIAKQILLSAWPHSKLIRNDLITKSIVTTIFSTQVKDKKFTVVVKGSEFQVSVWNALLQIPFGETSTYTKIAEAINAPKAVRAVGTACGKNNVCILIPCHRVLTAGGKLGGYRWGTKRKQKLLDWEASNA